MQNLSYYFSNAKSLSIFPMMVTGNAYNYAYL